MRILHIVRTIDPAAGGPTEVIRTLMRFAPAGYACEVVTLDDPASPFLGTLEFPVHALGNKPYQSGEQAWAVPEFAQWLAANRGRFDGAIVHGLWEYTGFAARKALLGHVPYAVFPHGMLDPYFKRAHRTKHLKKWLYWLLVEYRVLRDAAFVLFTTPLERDLAPQTFRPAKWTPKVVAIGAEAPATDAERNVTAFYERWPDLKGKRFLLFFGRIDPKKGPDLLLKAFAEVCRQQEDLSLVMAGPFASEYKRQLEAETFDPAMEGRVHWVGMLTGEVKWGALAACEAFVLPSHQENFGIAIVEALACGKPVLISNQINLYPEIEADGCGFVEADTLDGTRKLLTRWLATPPKERAAMGTRALQTFATRYDMRKNAAEILRVFERSAEGK